jgi:hypothetical protein
VTATSFGAEAQYQLEQPLGFSEDILKQVTEQRILSALHFNNMHERHQTVEKAHFQSFGRIFDDPSTPNVKGTGHCDHSQD